MDDRSRRDLDADLARLAQGDRSAFDPVFRAVWPPVLAVARRLVGDGADADDAAQEALLKVFARAGDYDPSRPALAWVLGVAAWECRTTLTRRRRSRIDVGASIDGVTSADDPEAACSERELVQALVSVLGSLDTSDREALEAAFDDARGPMSARLRKRKERALARLRAAWRSFHGAS